MKYTLLSIVSLIFLGLAPVAYGAVTINEIAWMGTLNSPNHEWIELYNDGGQGVDLEGWTLSDGASLSIALSGTIPAGGYAVLERTSDESAPGSAFLIYTGALVNTGATLVLRRSDAGIEDQIAGGENWESIGGDNASKNTAQYTPAGWVTGAPTPGAQNVAQGVTETVAPVRTATTETISRSGGQSGTVARVSKSVATPLKLADVSLSLSVKAQTLGYVNQTIEFTAVPSGLGETITNSLQYAWNFGDSATATGKTVRHFYQYPGTYAVTLYGAFGRHEQVSVFEITILPVALSLARTQAGDIQLHNDAQYDIDISGYRLQGGTTFVFPPRSIILSRQTITIPRQKVEAGLIGAVALADAKRAPLVVLQGGVERSVLGEALASPSPSVAPAPPVALGAPASPVVISSVSTPAPSRDFIFASSGEEAALSGTAEAIVDVAPPLPAPGLTQSALAGNAPAEPLQAYGPYFGLVVLIIIAAIGLLTTRGRSLRTTEDTTVSS